MRLLHSETLRFREFFSDCPPYAILSHTWGAEELSHADMLSRNDAIQARRGYAKIEGCCKQARKDGYKYVWIDTICIDKTSSAELSEAINSMYSWYQRSSVCYVYLSDIDCLGGYGWFLSSENAAHFKTSRWFSRGWTLQELIAPARVEFYSRNWVELGTKASLERHLEEATGIRVEVLRGASPSICSAAERMSWASKRHTTRVEDIAYSLLGIFSVNMPLLYGEGKNAFLRLQLEILQQNEDYSLFASPGPWTPGPWTHGAQRGPSKLSQSPLALSPDCFDVRSLQQKLHTVNDGYEEPVVDPVAEIAPSLSWSSFVSFRHPTRDVTDEEQHLFGPILHPATVTNRGLRLTVLAKRWSKLRTMHLVWTSYVHVEMDAYLCSFFRTDPNASYGSTSAPLMLRVQAHGLALVPFRVLEQFEHGTLFVQPRKIPSYNRTRTISVIPTWICHNDPMYEQEGGIIVEASYPSRETVTEAEESQRNWLLTVAILSIRPALPSDYKQTRAAQRHERDGLINRGSPIRIAVLLGCRGSNFWCTIRHSPSDQLMLKQQSNALLAFQEYGEQVRQLPPETVHSDRALEIIPSGDVIIASVKPGPERGQHPRKIRVEVTLVRDRKQPPGRDLRVARSSETMRPVERASTSTSARGAKKESAIEVTGPGG